MVKSILVLDPSYDPAKKIYTLQNNTINIKHPVPNKIVFDDIQYNHDGAHHRIIYNLVASLEHQPQVTLNIVYNGSSISNDQNITKLLKDILQLKIFSRQDGQFAHFDIRNGQVCDYNRNIPIQNAQLSQQSIASHQRDGTDLCQLQIFDQHNKQSIKSASINQIQSSLRFIRLRKDKLGHIFIDKKQSQFVSSRINNQFYILRFGKRLKIVVFNLFASKYQSLSHIQERQFMQFLLMKKHTISRKVQFTSLLVKVISKLMEKQKTYQLNFIISYFPCFQENLQLTEIICSQDSYMYIGQILDGYNKQKSSQVAQEINSMQTKIFNLKLQKKIQQENIAIIMNRYKKSFERLGQSLAFLKKNSITNISKYTSWIENQINKKKNQIQDQQNQLKELNTQLIKAAQNQDYFYKKLMDHRDRIVGAQGRNKFSRKRTIKHMSLKRTQNEQNVQSNNGIKQAHFYEQQAKVIQLQKSKQKIFIDLQQRINQLQERKQFTKLISQIKNKVSSRQFTKIQQRYYDLIQD